MKLRIQTLFIALALLASLTQTARAAVAFTVTPAAVSNTYSGTITLLVTGLTNTETVVVQKFLDANANGVIDAGDILWQQFNLTDGTSVVIGGVTNINVPGDTDTTVGQITAKQSFRADFSQLIVGKYLFKLSSSSGHFTPITNSFTVTSFPYAQQFTGTVVSNGVAVANAAIILFPGGVPGGNGGNPIGGAVANNSGSYTVQAPPGTYSLMAFKRNFVADMNAAANLVLGSGATLNTNLSLIGTTQSISGKIVDANNSSIGLPGFLVPVSTQNGLLGICFTDTNGNFTAQVNADQWKIEGDSAGLAVLGYLGLQNKVRVDTTTGSVSSVTIALPKATALFYGTVKDTFGNPLPGVVAIYASDSNINNNYNGEYQSDGYTDANGNYVTAVVGGLGSNDPWQVQVDNKSDFPNYIFSQSALQQNGGTNLAVGQAVLQNFTATLATNRISGNLKFNGTNIAGVGVSGYATINGVNYSLNTVDTDSNGNYSLNVANGTWSVSVSCCCNNDSLDNILGNGAYQCPGNQNVTIDNNNGAANFTVQPCNGIQITTTNLPDGQVNSYYNIQLQASSCNGNFNWSLNSGTLPPGLTLYSGGPLNGMPSASGTYYFSVHVSDGSGNSTNQSFSLFIGGGSGPLQIGTTALPNGLVSNFYSQPLNASGGQSPYSWSLTPGSLALPAGVSLSASGIVSGTPATAAVGTNYFSVRVTDNLASTADQLLSLAIYPALTMATNALPNGTVGTPYNAQILVSGGNASYGYSYNVNGALPPGLDVSSGAVTSSNELFVITGTPTNSGAFPFTFQAYDLDFHEVQQNFSITILISTLQITTASLSNATVGVTYSNQLQASGGTTPYTWTIANGSQPLPSALALSTSGVISGVPAASGTNSFIVRLTDHNSLTVTRAFALITTPKPVLSLANWSVNRFQMRLAGAANQNYTVQMSTNLSSTNWISLFITNNTTTNSFIVTDPNATNKQRFYRILIGP